MPENYEHMSCSVITNNEKTFPNAMTIVLPEQLHSIYGSDLAFIENPYRIDRPVTFLNFVIGGDGVCNRKDSPGGGPISLSNQADAFGMALLRASTDAVMIGSNTLRSEPRHIWNVDFIFDHFPQMKGLEHLRTTFKKWRRHLGKTSEPPTYIMTNSGDITWDAELFHRADIKKFIVTGTRGGQKIRNTLKEHGLLLENMQTTILEYGTDTLDAGLMMRELKNKMGVNFLLHEGGRGVASSLVQEGLIHQLFLTRMTHNVNNNVLLNSSIFEYLFGEPGKTAPTGARLMSDRIDHEKKAQLLSYSLEDVESL